MKTKENTATITAPPSTVQGPTWGDVTAAAPVLTAAMWCSSVGTTWTLELHTRARRTAYGTLVDWISSGIPITQPVPANRLARQLRVVAGSDLGIIEPCYLTYDNFPSRLPLR